jgi:hypothetical protein
MLVDLYMYLQVVTPYSMSNAKKDYAVAAGIF